MNRIILITLLLTSCGEIPTGSGFHCINGTPAECALVEQAEAAFVRCGIDPPWSRFHFAHPGDSACSKFPDHWCGFCERVWDDRDAGYDPDIWLDRCKEVCTQDGEEGLKSDIAHEALHQIYGDSRDMHPPEFWGALDKILEDCWEAPTRRERV